jgi:CheY-like chemotaxis protein
MRPEGRPQRADTSRIARSRVLLAEDNDVNALLARRMLEKVGCVVVHVTDGVAAVDAVRSSLDGHQPPFDLVLMDLHMPRLGGIEATAELRRLAALPGGPPLSMPPIVALTANAFAEDRQRCLAAGLDDYLAKPFDKHELLAMIERWRARGPTQFDPSDNAGTAA